MGGEAKRPAGTDDAPAARRLSPSGLIRPHSIALSAVENGKKGIEMALYSR